ncbi:MAG: MotA/TolQ/ExbB proton channel family protein [Candidatus Omnitrophica bacterium]|nr:MotA/TolQ/ExbB proton channel family protein [Candidatus Omnitrophota bacterium]MBU1996922.1 MotA/TolQ/ExbB proton channel family protein [Candidatus Omnitrophota bacterium]MBU4334613.1 MotA/TolQ/ExbB proton channel family protein [Candidatus Omnitrophota bacterium]
MSRQRKMCIGLLIMVFLTGFLAVGAIAQKDAGQELKPYINNVEEAKGGMTVFQMMKAGGFIMIILAAISVCAVAFIVYNFRVLKIENLVPAKFTDDLITMLEEGEGKRAYALCQTQDNIISNIVAAGLEKRDKGDVFAKEAIEAVARQEVGGLWQNISYLADIATVAPLIGLLGTVLGMIQAFNVIAFQTAVVKPILLAGGVSKAMVTTAGGLIVAIPAMLFYSYFKGKVIEISNLVESYSTDITKLIQEIKKGK